MACQIKVEEKIKQRTKVVEKLLSSLTLNPISTSVSGLWPGYLFVVFVKRKHKIKVKSEVCISLHFSFYVENLNTSSKYRK